MTSQTKPRTGVINGRLWGASAKDWATIQEHTCAAVYRAVFDHLNIGKRDNYLDVGCGSGLATKFAAERGVNVNGIDAAHTLIAHARERTPTGDFRVSDIESIPFEDNTFSCITGFNSFQYAGNPTIALKEAKRVAKTDATVVVMTWGEPENMEAARLVSALKPLLPTPPPGAPGPFALSEERLLRQFASTAGLQPVEVFDVDSPWHYPNLETAMRGLRSSGVALRAVENTSEQAVNEAHQAVLESFVQDDGSLKIGATFRCLIASV